MPEDCYAGGREAPTVSRCSGYVAVGAVAVVVLLGGALRAYRLEDQALWIDEYGAAFRHLAAPDVRTHLILTGTLAEGQDSVVYHGLQYFWSRIAGRSVLALRLLPLTCGVLSVPLLYWIGCLVFDRRVGFLAALFLAISPEHIFLSKTLRPYALVMLLALVSIYAFLRVLRGGGVRWWVLSLAANVLLVWTHYLQICLVLVELCVLFFMFVRVRPRATVLWCVLQGVVLIPWAFRVSRLTPLHVIRMTMPNVRQLIEAFSGGVIPFLGLLFAVALGWLAVTTVRLARREGSGWADIRFREGLAERFLLVLIATGPVALLAVLTCLSGLRFLHPRYLLYAGVGHFVALAALLSSLGGRRVGAVALAVVGAGWMWELSASLPGTIQTHWTSLASHVEENAGPNDVVLAGSRFAAALFRVNGDNDGIPTFVASNFRAACDMSNYLLAQEPAYGRASEEARSVWLVYIQAYYFGPIQPLEHKLDACGLSFRSTQFSGWQNLIAYRVWRDSERDSSGDSPRTLVCVPVDERQECDELLEALGVGPLDDVTYRKYIQFLRRLAPPPSPWGFELGQVFRAVVLLVEAGEYEAAKAVVRLEPWTFERDFALGVVLASMGDDVGAKAAFEDAIEFKPLLAGLLTPFVEAWCDSKDYEAALDAARRLEEMNFYLGMHLRVLCRQRVEADMPRLPFGIMPVTEADYEDILPALESPHWLALDNPTALYVVGEVLELQHRQDEALVFYRAAIDEAPSDFIGCEGLGAAIDSLGASSPAVAQESGARNRLDVEHTERENEL